MMKLKAQSWSVDILLAVIVFMVAFFIVYGILNTNPNAKAGSLKQEASDVVKQIASEESLIRVVDDNNEVNESRLGELKNMEYIELKKKLRVEGDFCIYFEDENGNIVLINDTYKGIGTSNIEIGSTPCSQR